MSVKYRVWKVRRDGVSQRYWVNPSREHDDAVTAVISGDFATAESRREQELARKLLQNPSVQESLYRSVVRQFEKTVPTDVGPVWFMQNYLARGYPEAESLLVQLATEPPDRNVRFAAIYTIATSDDPFAPRLLREVADKAPDEWTARTAIAYSATYLEVAMENLIRKKLMPTREAVLDALETLGLAMQGKWFEPKDEIGSILAALDYFRFDFEKAVQGQIPARVEETLIDGLVSLLSLESLSNDEFEKALNVIKNWRSAYSLPKLRSLSSDALLQQRRQMVINAINEIEHQLKRNSSQ